MNLENISKTFEEAGADIKIDSMFWLTNTAKCGSMPDGFKYDFLGDGPERIGDVLRALGILQHLTEEEIEEWNADYICDVIFEKNPVGFLLLAATPIPKDFTETGGYRTSGFGHYTTKWFYAEDLEKFASDAVDWAESVIEKYRAEAAA